MKLIVISPSKSAVQEPKIVTSLLESGVNTFHIRKPSMTTIEMCNYIESIPEHFHDRLVIHSHHKLASTYDLCGIHLTKVHRKRKFSTWFRIRRLKLRNANIVVSTSFHKLGEIYTNTAHFNYAFLGTLFNGLSGTFNPGFNEQSIQAGRARSTVPLVARGGITKESLLRCANLNLHGAALASCIWDQVDPVRNWCEIIKLLEEHDIPHT